MPPIPRRYRRARSSLRGRTCITMPSRAGGPSYKWTAWGRLAWRTSLPRTRRARSSPPVPGRSLLTPGASPGILGTTLWRYPEPVAEEHTCGWLDRVALLCGRMSQAHTGVIRADAHRENDEGVEEVVQRALPRRHAALGDEDQQAQHKAQHQRRPARGQAERDPQRVGDQHRDAARDAGREHGLGLQELVDAGPLHHDGYLIRVRTRVASRLLSTSSLCSAV